ncbi:MAG TPA: tail fiber protein [Longimicrobium sp.]|jgi:microcystin-dependent protein
MADPFVAEIRIFPFTFPPKGWAFCNGQLLPLSQNTALFSLLGTTYGGDGKSTFALPDLQGSAAMHPGQGSGLSLRDLGEIGGVDSITLLVSEMPFHTHTMMASIDPGDNTVPGPPISLGQSLGAFVYVAGAPDSQMAPQALPPAGGSLPHNNLQPYLTLNFNIALQGVFPPRG